MENDPAPKPYKLYEDKALIDAAEGDDTLHLLLQGLRGAEQLAAERPENPALQNVAKAAEEAVRFRIETQGYMTHEIAPPEE
jgi:hypothetical protein